MKKIENDFNSLIDDKKTIDVIIKDEKIYLHKIFLFRCDYFKNIFKLGMSESINNEINFDDLNISKQGLVSVIKYLYTDNFFISNDIVIEVLLFSSMIDLKEVYNYLF
jgi:hypothetical protein